MKYSELKCLPRRRAILPPVPFVPLGCFLLHSLLVFGAVILAGDKYLQAPGGFINPLLTTDYPLVEKFLRWDAHWYTYVAQQGYNEMSIVFFPMLIYLMKGFAPFFHYDYGVTGFVICNVFSFFSFIMMYKLFQLDFSKEISYRALLAYAVMPTSFFLNSVYTEPLFLSFTLTGVYYARQGRWWQGGLFMSMACLTRNLGIFLMLLLLFEIGEKYNWHFTELPGWHTWLGILLVPAGFLGYAAYNDWLLGNPLAFVQAQKAWGRIYSPPWDNIMNSIQLLQKEAQAGTVMDLTMVILGLSGMLFLTFGRYRLPKSYLLVGWLWLIIPLWSTTVWMPLYSLCRFVLVIFPLYLWLAQLPRSLYFAFLLSGSAGLILLSVLFTSWYWIG